MLPFGEYRPDLANYNGATSRLAQTTRTSAPSAATVGASPRRCETGPPRSRVET